MSIFGIFTKISFSANQKPVYVTWETQLSLLSTLEPCGHFKAPHMFLRPVYAILQPIKRSQRRKKGKKMSKISPFLTLKFRNFRSKNEKKGDAIIVRI